MIRDLQAPKAPANPFTPPLCSLENCDVTLKKYNATLLMRNAGLLMCHAALLMCHAAISTLRLLELQTEADVADFFRKNLTSYRAQSGAITFLYALIHTKGLDRLQSEMGDSAEPLGTPCAATARRV